MHSNEVLSFLEVGISFNVFFLEIYMLSTYDNVVSYAIRKPKYDMHMVRAKRFQEVKYSAWIRMK